MKLRLPLYARILLWFLLNVVVLALAFSIVAHLQFGRGFSTALGSLAGDRVRVVAERIHYALSQQPSTKWDRILADFSEQYDVHAALFRAPDRFIAGEPMHIPPEVNDEARAILPARGRPGPPPPRREGPPGEVGVFGDGFLSALGGDAPPPEGPPDDGPGAGPEPWPSRVHMFMKVAQDSPRYWVGVHLPPPEINAFDRAPWLLFIASDSVTANGLFFDVKPWVWGILGALVVSALLWLPFVQGITHSVRLTMKATESIAQGRFDVRVPETRGDELGRMAQAVNLMAGQLDGYVRGQKRFLGDIAHELCSPIARMEVGLSILENKIGEQHGERLEGVRSELRDISAMVNELLSFSKAASGMDALPPEPVHLRSIVEESARTEGIAAELLRLDVDDALVVLARADLLKRAIGNVLRNAQLHAPGAMHISASRRNGHVLLTLADEGPGVPADSLPRLFEPFYRVDTSRTRDTGGTGLGLAIVKTCVEACGGTVTASNREPHGLAVVFKLSAVKHG